MFELKVTIEGERVDDLAEALQVVLESVKRGPEAGGSCATRWIYTFGRTGLPEEYFSLLVENIGWVVDESDHETSLGEILALYEQYIQEDPDRQVSVWSSNASDPIYDHSPERREGEDSE
jgi:hypothetical protein